MLTRLLVPMRCMVLHHIQLNDGMFARDMSEAENEHSVRDFRKIFRVLARPPTYIHVVTTGRTFCSENINVLQILNSILFSYLAARFSNGNLCLVSCSECHLTKEQSISILVGLFHFPDHNIAYAGITRIKAT